MSTSRAEILRNIRLALAKPAPAQRQGNLEIPDDTERLFRSASAKNHLVEKFQTEFELVSGEFIRSSNNETAAMWLNIFKDIVIREQIDSSAYKTGSVWNSGSKRTTVFINITRSTVYLYVQRAEFYVALNNIASGVA